jgi:WhiB family transcriptional regulator, redox-sensing transcriptional regulator
VPWLSVPAELNRQHGDDEWFAADPGDRIEAALLLAAVGRPAWWDEAACLGVGPDSFFPARGGTLDAARALCGRCSARERCLTDALALDPFEDQGFRAGYTDKERRQLRRAAA